MSNKISVFCVVYNDFFSDSLTIKSFLDSIRKSNFKNVYFDLFVWDNSTLQCFIDANAKFADENRFTVFGNGRNNSLSVVYNKVIDLVDSDFICIFDHDSNVDMKYLNQVHNATFYPELTVAVPKVFSQLNLMYSPAKLGIVRGIHLSDIQVGFHKDLTAITSGTFINIPKLKASNVCFDEKLTLYGVDTLFFWTLSEKNVPIYVLDVKLSHDLSCFNNEPKDIKIKRLANLRSSNLYFAKKRGRFYYILSFFYWFLVSLKKSLVNFFKV
ncbi:hypothetical protein [Vibrio metschnikovii]|uniref:hypothetical protein n=1 Tax=Vibrio metschnikovii TaxID=28172 RepID=UPI001C3041E2|nr:hypothetical protein [Vibrio metschnikovii]